MTNIQFFALAATSATAVASPYATSVLSYSAGSNPNPAYTDPTAALGAPARMTGTQDFVSGVTPFNPPFAAGQLVSVGSGGHLALELGRLATDNPTHRYGVDLIVFSSAFFVDHSYFDADPTNDGSGLLGPNPALFGAGGVANVSVSADGVDWRPVAVTALGLFPTLGYADFPNATPTEPGAAETDFTRAMDPGLALADLAGMSFAQLVALYDGSGGGIGIDIASSGLDAARFVRFDNLGSEAFNIDAVAVVPTPGAAVVLLGAGLGAFRRRAR